MPRHPGRGVARIAGLPESGQGQKGQGYPVRYRSEPDIPSGLNGSGVPRTEVAVIEAALPGKP
jgi:hypothetical protein